MRIAVSLAMLVRQTKTVTIDVPDDFDLDKFNYELCEVLWEMDDGVDFKTDDSWGCEEGTHDCWVLENSIDSADYILDCSDNSQYNDSHFLDPDMIRKVENGK